MLLSFQLKKPSVLYLLGCLISLHWVMRNVWLGHSSITVWKRFLFNYIWVPSKIKFLSVFYFFTSQYLLKWFFYGFFRRHFGFLGHSQGKRKFSVTVHYCLFYDLLFVCFLEFGIWDWYYSYISFLRFTFMYVPVLC